MLRKTVTQVMALPRHWLLPRGERAVLAVVGAAFWAVTVYQALFHPAAGASVFSFFGLGLGYVVFSLVNLMGGLRAAVKEYLLVSRDDTQSRMLSELLVVLSGMAALNALVVAIYAVKGASFTFVDLLSVGVDAGLICVLLLAYGKESFLKHPIARGWLAIAGKTVPQLVLAGLFIARPDTAVSIAVLTLIGIDVLSGLRFIPTLKAYLHDRSNRHLAGLLLGEAGNLASGLLLTLAWVVAHYF